MKTAILWVCLATFTGCSGNAADNGDMSTSTGNSSATTPVTFACCTFGGGTTCSSDSVVVQWDDRYWTSNPEEDDAGACQTGESCTAYSRTDGGLQPIGNGTCE